MTKNATPPDRYGLVGHPVGHSRSPRIHASFARQTGERLTYELIDVLPAEFATAVHAFGAAGGKGLNVTVPHKEAAFALVEETSDAAALAGAVNTLAWVNGRLHGHNTDGVGFIRDVTVNHQQALVGLNVVVLGAGGAARGIAGPLLEQRPRELVFANRTPERARQLVAHLVERAGAATSALTAVSFDELSSFGAFDVVVNATSAGLKREAPAFSPSVVGPQSFCYDLVYGAQDTPFVTWARARGASRAVQGWGMLVEQAAESYCLWRGLRPDTAPLLKPAARAAC